NLLVPVCLSSTHVAFASIRMEPQYMIIGQASGIAAALAVGKHVPVQEISIPELQRKLHEHGAILHRSVEIPSRASTPSKP
ncbi:MAG: FAD-dependent oxidoreductase, partial [Terracidiphilus sp.]|nr:FAD-dependent oxidoreductase [Terracidiphilus sp.]